MVGDGQLWLMMDGASKTQVSKAAPNMQSLLFKLAVNEIK